MAFNYEENLGIDRDFVRFWTGDTVSGESFLSDEIIASLLSVEETKQKATLAALRYIISQLSKPNFRADWLQVDYQTAREGYEKKLRDLEHQFGLAPTLTVHSINTYRGDSGTIEAPDFSDGRAGEDV